MASGGGGGWAETEPETCQASGDRTIPGRSLDICANCGCRGMYEGICGLMEVSVSVAFSSTSMLLYLLAGDSRRRSGPPG
ncbi:hypothetical protein M5D96_007221 [Drosophila gunungcola]|uniref:Uncharacterized protein n=1 Tax=Drosophila gunungcola TaxID=103775 RepID=A0A9Q0BPB8_9MUSC|nr:hypothetical protein M5D96_007221 [Drosophila gunungcola]